MSKMRKTSTSPVLRVVPVRRELRVNALFVAKVVR